MERGSTAGRVGHRPPGRAIRRTLARIGAGLLAALLLLGGIALRLPLVQLDAPREGQVVGFEGLELMIRFRAGELVAPETLRVLLNGADVTAELTTASNGAYGRLYGLLDGENVLRVEVFGRVWPLDLLVERGEEVRILRRRPLDLHRG